MDFLKTRTNELNDYSFRLRKRLANEKLKKYEKGDLTAMINEVEDKINTLTELLTDFNNQDENGIY